MAVDLVEGQAVGSFIFLRREYVGKNRIFVCKCKCGSEKVFWKQSAILRQKTCGCGTDDVGLTAKQRRSMTSRMNGYKAGAKKRGISWNLSYEQFSSVASKPCSYCGTDPKKWDCVSNAPSVSKDCPNIIADDYVIHFNGVDRIDSRGGYTVGNVVSCCTRCNRAKNDMTVEEFKDHVERLYKWLFQVA